jgi:hypothetical protein
MATAADSTSKEYWRPSNPQVARVIPSIRDICWRCGMDYSPGARFCHICGGPREANTVGVAVEPAQLTQEENLNEIRQRLGLSIASVVLLVIGLTCGLAAALTGLVYKQETLVDWQAVQTWRIEWLLAAAVALLAGIMLKKK